MMVEEEEKPSLLFRLALVGDSGTGKTALMLRYTDDIFYSNTHLTIGVEWKFKTMEVEGKKIRLQLWDTAGQERFSSLAPMYCRKADAVLLFFDLTRPFTFEHVDYWNNMINAQPECLFVLVGSKVDMSNRMVAEESGLSKSNEIRGGVRYFETSAKDDINIDAIFDYLVPLLMKKKVGSHQAEEVGTIKLHGPKKEKKHSNEKCCSKK